MKTFSVSFRAPNWTVKNENTISKTPEKALNNVVYRYINNYNNGSSGEAKRVLSFLEQNKKQFEIKEVV